MTKVLQMWLFGLLNVGKREAFRQEITPNQTILTSAMCLSNERFSRLWLCKANYWQILFFFQYTTWNKLTSKYLCFSNSFFFIFLVLLLSLSFSFPHLVMNTSPKYVCKYVWNKGTYHSRIDKGGHDNHTYFFASISVLQY